MLPKRGQETVDAVSSWTAPTGVDSLTPDEWDTAASKVFQTSLLLVVTKLAASWGVAAFLSVPMRGRLIWGFVPYAGLETTPAKFRDVATWSTVIAALAALAWTTWHLARRRKRAPIVSWAAALALPMIALLAVLEWWRRFNGDHLLATGWLVRILLTVGVAFVLFVGFAELPWSTRRDKPNPRSSAEPPNHEQPNPLAMTVS